MPASQKTSQENTSQNSSAVANPLEREVVIERILDASRELVFEAWTNPEHLRRWWGPTRFTNPVCEVDARLGGAWRVVMRGPDGKEYPCAGTYREFVRPERLVFTNGATDAEGKLILDGLTTVIFEELISKGQAAKTKLTLRTRATGLVSYAAEMLAGMEAGWSQSLERLATLVGEGSGGTADATANSSGTADREIVTTRVFDARRELVYEAWTDPRHLAQWWGPNGFTSTIQEMDVRPGGIWRMIMHGPDGVDYPNESVFREVVKPERLVYSHLAPRFEVTVTFEEQGGKTLLTMRMVFETATERERVVKVFGAIEGAKQTLGRLAEFVAG